MEAPAPMIETDGKINPFEDINKEQNKIILYFDVSNENYKLAICKDKNKGGILFLVDQEENISTKYFFVKVTLSELYKLGKSFKQCDSEDEVIDEIRYIINQKKNNEKGFDISLIQTDIGQMAINFCTQLRNGIHEELSINLSEKNKSNYKLNIYLIDYIKRLKKKSGIKSLNDNKSEEIRKSKKIKETVQGENNFIVKSDFNKSQIVKCFNDIDFIHNYINYLENKNASFNLIFQSSLDGDKGDSFHRLCDNISPILVVLKTKENVVFGGYTNIPVNKEGPNYDKKAFCFNIDNKKIYKSKKSHHAIYNRKLTLVAFSDEKSDVVFVGERFLNNSYPFCTCAKSKSAYSGMKKDYEINNGNQRYFIQELEIYQVFFG